MYVSQWSYFRLWVLRSKIKVEGHDISRNAQITNNKNWHISVIFLGWAKFKEPQRSTPQGLSSWHHQLPFRKFALTSKWRLFWKFWNILDRFILTLDMERPSEMDPQKVLLMLMTTLMTSQRDVKVGLLYSCLNEIVTFSAIKVAVFDQSSPNLVHIWSLPKHRTL